MQWSLQSKVRRTQLRFSWAASSWDSDLVRDTGGVGLFGQHRTA